MPFAREVALFGRNLLTRQLLPNLINLVAHTRPVVAQGVQKNVSHLQSHKQNSYTQIQSRGICSKTNNQLWQLIIPRGDLHDVGGYENIKKDLSDFIEYFHDIQKWKEYGLRAPKGAIFMGPAGTGKSEFAEKLAGHAGVSFIRVNATHLFDTFNNSIKNNLAKVFKDIQAYDKCVLCIDEIDFIAPRRTDDKSVQIKNVDSNIADFLHEIEKQRDGVLIIGTTKSNLDPAITRPGRLDKVINFDLPELHERVAILKILTRDLEIKKVNFNFLAQISTAFSGAHIDAWVNEAKKIGMKNRSNVITQQYFMEAFVNLSHGSGKKHSDPETEYRIAVHEAGHAFVAHKLGIKVLYISILQTAISGGVSRTLVPEEAYYTKDYLLDLNCMLLSGRAAEAEYNVVQLGSHDDISKVMYNLENMNHEGMGSEIINASTIELYNLANSLYDKAREIIKNNIEEFDRLVSALLKYKLIYGDDVTRILDGRKPKNLYPYLPDMPLSRLGNLKALVPVPSIGNYGVFKNKPGATRENEGFVFRSKQFLAATKAISKFLEIDENVINEFREDNGKLEIIFTPIKDQEEFYIQNKHFENIILPFLQSNKIKANYFRWCGINGNAKLVIEKDSRIHFSRLICDFYNARPQPPQGSNSCS